MTEHNQNIEQNDEQGQNKKTNIFIGIGFAIDIIGFLFAVVLNMFAIGVGLIVLGLVFTVIGLIICIKQKSSIGTAVTYLVLDLAFLIYILFVF